MKANKKFIEKEAGVSAVIGVILMVAITVAIAATVYVYVSGMMGTGQEAAPTLTFIKEDKATVNTLTVISADPSDISWGDIELLINGTAVDKIYKSDNTAYGTGDTINAGNVIDISETAYHFNSTLEHSACTISIRHIPTNTLIGTYAFTGS